MSVYQSLLLVIAGTSQRELARQILYLMVENEVLRSRLPSRIVVIPKERLRLLEFGIKLGRALRELVTIVCPETILRWIREDKRAKKKGSKPSKRGRPRIKEEMCELIIRLAKENTLVGLRTGGNIRPASTRSQGLRISYVQRDRDGKHADVDAMLNRHHVKVIKGAVQYPNILAYVERFIGSIRRESLEHLLFFGKTHLDSVIKT